MMCLERFKHTIPKAPKNTGMEDARLNDKLSSLMEKVTFFYLSGQTADENLLLDVDSLLDDVRMEITALRGTNSDLWAQIAEINAGKRQLEEKGSAYSTPSKERIDLLTKVNAQLEHEVYVLCDQLTIFEIYREEELAEIHSEHDRVTKEHAMLVAKMKEEMKKKDKCREEERKVFEEKIAHQEKLHRADVLRSKEELKRTKESLHKDFLELKDSLKAAQSACKEETARLNEELDTVKQERDTLVRKLRRLARQGDVPRSDARKEEQRQDKEEMGDVPRSDSRKEEQRQDKEEMTATPNVERRLDNDEVTATPNVERRLEKDEMTATHHVVRTKPRKTTYHREHEEMKASPWATKPVWVKHGSFWVKNE